MSLSARSSATWPAEGFSGAIAEASRRFVTRSRRSRARGSRTACQTWGAPCAASPPAALADGPTPSPRGSITTLAPTARRGRRRPTKTVQHSRGAAARRASRTPRTCWARARTRSATPLRTADAIDANAERYRSQLARAGVDAADGAAFARQRGGSCSRGRAVAAAPSTTPPSSRRAARAASRLELTWSGRWCQVLLARAARRGAAGDRVAARSRPSSPRRALAARRFLEEARAGPLEAGGFPAPAALGDARPTGRRAEGAGAASAFPARSKASVVSGRARGGADAHLRSSRDRRSPRRRRRCRPPPPRREHRTRPSPTESGAAASATVYARRASTSAPRSAPHVVHRRSSRGSCRGERAPAAAELASYSARAPPRRRASLITLHGFAASRPGTPQATPEEAAPPAAARRAARGAATWPPSLRGGVAESAPARRSASARARGVRNSRWWSPSTRRGRGRGSRRAGGGDSVA